MANAILNVVLKNLSSLIEKEIGLLWGVEKEMEKLSSTLSTIQAVLEDAEQKQPQDKALQDWLRKLKHTAYVADDILDECATHAIPLESKEHNSGLLGKVHSSLLPYSLDNIYFRHKIGKKMKEITEKLDAIANERMKFHLRDVVPETRVEAVERRETSSNLDQKVYGREKDKEKIIAQLVEHASECQDISVYPIIGLGGIGKTTLVQEVFNDKGIISHFDLRIWVCVSQDFDVKRVIKSIIASASGKACEASDLDPLENKLQDTLDGKRFLLVLDDVWNEDQQKWAKIKSVLACGLRGASIIATTRLQSVASIMGPLPAHHLSGLSEDDCWSLFQQCAFGHEKIEDHPSLVAIGKEIVKKCAGVPLAAKTLGSLMRFKREENEWISVQESEIWNLPQVENSILPALRLSYCYLPLELRQCFAYCAVFSKAEIIEKENLIHLWMANGFISSHERLELEDIGNGIWNELYWRSFFQDVEEDAFGNIISFKIHDLIHDLAQSIMKDEGSLRTYISSKRDVSQLSGEFTKFTSLRVLDARFANIVKLPSSLGNLKHLRYLNLSYTRIHTLPKSIYNLRNLQILNLQCCELLQKLPKCLTRLKNLRHLYLDGCPLIHMPSKIGQLNCLKTLSLFVVGKKKGCQLSQLEDLNLGGQLRIEHLDRVGNLMEAKKANLIGKQNLRGLDLSWEFTSGYELQENVEQVLDGLQPHPNLKQLHIQGYKGTHFPIWVRDSVLKNLVFIQLSDCRNCLQLPPFGQLPSLRCLQISGMIFLEYIDSDSRGRAATGGFPSLEVLNISELPSLEGLFKDDEPELFPRLRIMNINNCPKLLMLPCLPSIEHLLIKRCSEVLLSSISNLSTLISLYVDQCEEVVYFSEEILRKLTVLESLTIESFPKLKVLPTTLANLTSLKLLRLSNCHELESLPEQALRGLHSLRRLVINGCNNVKSLYTGLQHLTGLESLGIGGFVDLGTFQTTRSLTGDVSGNDEAVSFTEEVLHRISFLAANRNVYQA